MNPGLPNADIFMETYQLWVIDADAEGRRRAEAHRSTKAKRNREVRKLAILLARAIERSRPLESLEQALSP